MTSQETIEGITIAWEEGPKAEKARERLHTFLDAGWNVEDALDRLTLQGYGRCFITDTVTL